MRSKGYNLIFEDERCEIRKGSKTMIATRKKSEGNIYQLKGYDGHCFMSQINNSWLWHQRMCHMNLDNIVRISVVQAMRDLPRILKLVNAICKDCQFGKQARNCFRWKEQSTTRLLDLIHTDRCGPTRMRSLQGDRYFMFLIDDYSRYTWVTFLREKHE